MSEPALLPRADRCPAAGEAASPVLPIGDAVVLAVVFGATRSVSATALALVAFRWAAVTGALLNEWAHLAVAVWQGAGRGALHGRNLLGHRPLRAHAWACLPFGPDRRGDLHVEIAGLAPAVARRVRVGGFWLSASAIVAAAALAVHGDVSTGLALALGGLLSVAASFVTDLGATSVYRHHPSRMGCGNLTLLGRLLPGETGVVPDRVGKLLKAMLHVTQLRGAQSGGGAVKVGVADSRARSSRSASTPSAPTSRARSRA